MAELCPFDQRRLPRELYVKFIVVHFVVIGAYSHLRHLRRERYNLHMYIFLVACPLAGLSLVTVPLIVLFIQAVITRGDRAVIYQSMEILLGQTPSDASVEAMVRKDIRTPLLELKHTFMERFDQEIPEDAQGIIVEVIQKMMKEISHSSGARQPVATGNTGAVARSTPRLESLGDSLDITDASAYKMMSFKNGSPGELRESIPEAFANVNSAFDGTTAFSKFLIDFLSTIKKYKWRLKKYHEDDAMVNGRRLPSLADKEALDAMLDGRHLQSPAYEEALEGLTAVCIETTELLESLESGTDMEPSNIEDRSGGPLKIIWESSRSLLLPLALLSQSLTSMWLFHRRFTRGSDALYDHRIFQAALLGLAVSIMTIIHLILKPCLPLEVVPADPRTNWVYVFRPGELMRRLLVRHAIYSEGIERSKDYSVSPAHREAAIALVSRFTDLLREWMIVYCISTAVERTGLTCSSTVNGADETLKQYTGVALALLASLWYLSPPLMASLAINVPFRRAWISWWRKNRYTSTAWTVGGFSVIYTIWTGPAMTKKWSFGLLNNADQLWALFSVPPNAQEYANSTYTPDAISFNGAQIQLNATFGDVASLKTTMLALSLSMVLAVMFKSTFSCQADRNGTFPISCVPGYTTNSTELIHHLSNYSVYNNTLQVSDVFDNLSTNLTLTFTPDWNRIWTFAHAPPDFPCPKAWKDPVADYVWWLA